MTEFSDYADARDFCDNRRKRKLAHNTYLRDHGDHIAIRFHSTDIVTYQAGSLTLSSGGWQTLTTKERMNRYLPSGSWDHVESRWKGSRASVWQALGHWYLTVSFEGNESATYDYEDGIALHDDGRVTVGGEPATVSDPDEDRRVYNRERYRARKAREATRHTLRAASPPPEASEREFEGMSHEEKKATLDARIATVLAECNPNLPLYKAT